MAKKRKMYKGQQDIGPKGQLLSGGAVPGTAGATGQSTDENDEEAMVVAETYAEYWPAKLDFGKAHPDPVVETASLSSVAPTDITYKLAIPDKTIEEGKLSALQLESIIYASQAHAQLLPDESRAGFLIGDGAGVGKGRTVAGIIFESFQLGRKKAIWVSVSADLVEDSKRDLRDIGAGFIHVNNLSKLKYDNINSKANGYIKEGVIFSTYSSLIAVQSGKKKKSRLDQLVQWFGDNFDGVIIFDECHKAKHLVNKNGKSGTKTGIAVEELQAKLPNARVVYASATGASEPRNMAYMVRLGLWGQGTPFTNFGEFLTAVEKRGVGAMEVVAMDMKLRGMYIARQLSFQGVTFQIEEVPFDEESEQVYNDSVDLWMEAYNNMKEAIELMKPEKTGPLWGQFWGAHQRFFKYLCIASKVKYAVKAAQDAVQDGKCVVIGLQSTGEARTLEELDMRGGEIKTFVSTAKAVFKSMIQKQLPAPRLLMKKQTKASEPSKPLPSKRKRSSTLKSRASVQKRPREVNGVIDLDSDSETEIDEPEDASDESDFSDNENDSDDSEKTILFDRSDTVLSDLDDFLDDDSDDGFNFKKSKRQKKGKDANENVDPKEVETSPEDEEKKRLNGKRAAQLKMDLLDKIEKLGERLPTNTLDNLIDLLGGTNKVAELTGRKGRVVKTAKGVRYESRGEDDVSLDKLNLVEKDRFMNGEKLIAIISEAASNGISLQSDRRAINTRRRVHITLELPWSADRAIQQFGRTHRANQVSPPEYIFLISDLAGERRFAASVAKRLESLGALTHGDRRATADTRDLSQFNVENKYGKAALRTVYKTINGHSDDTSLAQPDDYKGDFFGDLSNALAGVGLLEDIEGSSKMRRMKDSDKGDIAKFLNRILGLRVKLQNQLFKYFTDTMEFKIEEAKKAGEYDMGIMDMGNTDNVKVLDTKVFHRKHATGVAPIELYTVEIDRGITYDEAVKKCAESTDNNEGFYMQTMGSRQLAMIAMYSKSQKAARGAMQVYRPNVGMCTPLVSLTDMKSKHNKVTPNQAEKYWNHQYNASEKMCVHMYWYGTCKNSTAGFLCDIGLRKREYYLIAGSIFAVWQRIEHQIKAKSRASVTPKLQVVRMKTAGGRKIVGILVPKTVVSHIIDDLETDSVPAPSSSPNDQIDLVLTDEESDSLDE
ncbi:protein strawberry notch-like [Sitodiplosis mosellana]|uniref:protein strawberry notch-like n=1 Tax=Sitodiplosis mosellana TaxID=263140 RepID=UPI00244409A4|nr:protein strawberry notch-like [Sitodiplosis mosellana]